MMDIMFSILFMLENPHELNIIFSLTQVNWRLREAESLLSDSQQESGGRQSRVPAVTLHEVIRPQMQKGSLNGMRVSG